MSLRVVDALETAWKASPSPFLPSRTPLLDLPPGYEPLAQLEADMPRALHGDLPGARQSISAVLSHARTAPLPDPSRLPPAALDRLLTCCSLLGHAYRWDRIPSPSRDFHVDALDLPPALERVWRQAANARGIPMVGTLWTLLLANWRLEDRPGGAPFTTDELTPASLRILANFLPGPRGAELERFVVTFIRSEAVGADLLSAMVPLLVAAARDDEQTAAPLLQAVPMQVKRLVTVFLEQISPRTMNPDAWLDHIQRPYVWGVVDAVSGERYEGPSGMQLGVMSILNSLLDVQSHSPLAQSIRSSWRMLLPHQRTLLERCEACRPVLRRFVSQPGRRAMRVDFNAALDQLSAWRRCHQSRGTRYFQGSGDGPSMEASTGLVVDGGDNLLTHFLKAMEERLIETHQSRLFVDADTLSAEERAMVALIREALDDDNLIDASEAKALETQRTDRGISVERLQQLLSDRRLRSSFPKRDQAWLARVHAEAAACRPAEPDWETLETEGRAMGIASERLALLKRMFLEASPPTATGLPTR